METQPCKLLGSPYLKKEAALALDAEYSQCGITSVCGRRQHMEDPVMPCLGRGVVVDKTERWAPVKPSLGRGRMETQPCKLLGSPYLKKEAAQALDAEYPKCGMTSVCGRRHQMEDAVAIHPSFCRWNPENPDHLNFYGVYDGFEGADVALMCKDRLHKIVREEVDRSEEDSWEETMERSFSRMDKEVTDSQVETAGSTAVVAIVTPDMIIISNCGNSRAVLCRNGIAIPLSSEHTADRPDELDRIEKAGGRVIHWNGARVFGVLRMSRAIGCNFLKPFVISEPEVTIKDRTAEDEFLILASDGLWDVVSNDTACAIVRTCLKSQKPRSLPQSRGSEAVQKKSRGSEVDLDVAGESSDNACSDASSLLTKLALARGSKDNISVVVVDLKRDGGHLVLLDPLEQSTKSVAHGAREDQCFPTGNSVSSREQNDGGQVVLLDPLEQSTKNVGHGAGEDQCSRAGCSVASTEKDGEKDIKECRAKRAKFEDHRQHFGRRCEGTAKSLGGKRPQLRKCCFRSCSFIYRLMHLAKDMVICGIVLFMEAVKSCRFFYLCTGALAATRICSKHGINRVFTVKHIYKRHGIHCWPFRQKWATRKGYSLREERPFEVSTLSMDEKFDSRPLFINMSQSSRSSAWPLALPDGRKIVRPLSLSSSEFVASNNRACLVRQDQSDSTASQYERSTREMSDIQGIATSFCSAEDLQHHFRFKHKDAMKRLVHIHSLHVFDLPRTLQLNFSGGLTAQSASTLHWPIGLPGGGQILSLSKKNIVRKTFKRMSRTISVRFENHQQHFGSRYEGAANSLAKRISKQHGINPVSMLKWTCRRHWFHRWPFRQSASSLHWPISLPDRGHILPLSKMYIVRKTFKRMSRPMSVRFEAHHQHFGSRYEGAANSLAKCISKQHGINLVSVVKWTHRRHEFHRWPFRQGYSLGGERLAKVVSLSMVEKLVSRLQFLHMSWFARSSRRPLALLSGSKIVGHIAFSSSEFATTNIRAHPGRQDQCGSSASRPEKERTRETRIWEGIASHVISFEDLQQHFGSKREDVAKFLGISVSTFKRICRHHGINRWPYRTRKKVWRPPDPHGENNPSPMFNTLPTIGQNTRENEMGGHNPGPIELLPDAFEDVNFWITGNGSTAEIENTPTFNDSFPGHFQHGDFLFSSVFSEIESTGGSLKWPYQLEGQSTLATPYSNPNALVCPGSQIASTQVLRENMGNLEDRRNLPASQEERFMEGLVCESSNLMIPSCSDAAALCQPVAAILNMMPTIPDIIPHFTSGVSEAFQLEGQSTESTHPNANPNAFVFLQTQIESTQMAGENMGSSEVQQNVVAFEKETLPTCSDPNPSQSMPPISDMTPTVQMMSHLTTREHMRSVTLKLTYEVCDTKAKIIKFPFSLASGITELKKEVTKRLNLELGSFDIEYKDEDGDSILLGCDEDLRTHIQHFSNQVIRLLVVDSGANTTNERESSGSFKRKRP